VTEQEAINSLLDFLARCAVEDVLAEQLEDKELSPDDESLPQAVPR
jgi:hypothetical protein